MRLMAEGIDDRRAHSSDDPILSRPGGGGASVAPAAAPDRRITADTRVPGYTGRDE